MTFATPEELANLSAVITGEFGPGPFWWVDPYAQRTNLLTPEASTLDGGTWGTSVGATVTAGGAVALDGGGRAGRSLVIGSASDTVFLPRHEGARDDIPVTPSRPVTASVWATGSSVQVGLRFVDAAGTLLTTAFATHMPGGIMRRISVTGTPPTTAVACYLGITGATRIARPAITWTSDLKGWDVGQGIPRAVITAMDGDVIAAWDSLQGRSATFLVTEVG
jgi:hypothetical protein